MIKTYQGGCHCGAVKFSFKSLDIVEIWICNCSICSLLEYEHLFIEKEEFNIKRGKEFLNSYKFGTGNADHLFCSKCGIKSYYQPRSHPSCFSVNLKCVENPPKVKKQINFDGINFEEPHL